LLLNVTLKIGVCVPLISLGVSRRCCVELGLDRNFLLRVPAIQQRDARRVAKSASRFPRVSHDFEIDVMTERRHTQAFIAMAYSMESYGRGVIISETLQND
jgi:hypothetical protein